MSKKAIIWICSAVAAAVAIVSVLLIFLLPKDKNSGKPNKPDIFTEVDVGNISIKQDAGQISTITAKFKSFSSNEFETLRTKQGNDSLSAENSNEELMFSGDNFVLNKDNPYIIFQFEIKNNGENNIAAILNFESASNIGESLTFTYSHNGEDFSHEAYGEKANSGLSILVGESEKYYVKIALKEKYYIDEFDGEFEWSLVEIDNSHLARIGTTSYQTIEQAAEAAQYGDIICIIDDIYTTTNFAYAKLLYIYADRDLTWNTSSESGIIIPDCFMDINNGMKVTPYSLWLGCKNGNNLTLKSNGGANAILMGSSSLYLGADIVCGTQNPTTNCVGIRKVESYDITRRQFHNELFIYGGTISGFYYGIVDITDTGTYHIYEWGSIYNCTVGMYYELSYDYGISLNATVSLGTNDKTFYIYSCSDHAIYYKGEIYYNDASSDSYVRASSDLIINNLVLGQDEAGNMLTDNSGIVGCALTLDSVYVKVFGKLICNNYSQTPILLNGNTQIRADGADLIELKNNRGESGAAIHATSSYGMLIANAVISGNISTNNGGAIYTTNGYAHFEHCTIENNQSGGLGGAIASTGGSVSFDYCKVTGNISQDNGGVVYAQNASVRISDSEIYNNTSYGDGGALFIAGSKKSYISEGAKIYNNSAKTRGGAVRVFEGAYLEMSGGKIYNNSVNNMSAKASGGGVYINSGAGFLMKGGEIYNNTATGLTSYGGNVYVSGEYKDENQTVEPGEFYFTYGLISGDGVTKQAMNGGGIANLGLCFAFLSEIKDCVADYGAAIYNTGTLQIYAVKISSLTTIDCIGKSIVNIGTLHLAEITLLGNDMDIVIACTEKSGEVTAYAITNVAMVDYSDDKQLGGTYRVIFATYDSETKQMSLKDDFISHYIDNSLAIITYGSVDGEKSPANPNNFINEKYNFVLTDDGCGLTVETK